MKLQFLFGTETGNSEMLCEDMVAELGAGFDCDIANLADVDPTALDRSVFHIFVTSTYGNGDLPSQAVAFETAMEADAPDLKGLSFAIFGLGDQVFAETFAHGSERLAKLLVSAGATMVGTRGIHDASSLEMPEDVGLPWLSGIIAEVQAEAA